jgi:hypothetical protein
LIAVQKKGFVMFIGPTPQEKRIQEEHRKKVEKNPAVFGITGALSLGIDAERMQQLKEKIEAREANTKAIPPKQESRPGGGEKMGNNPTAEKICVDCEQPYKPRSNVQKRCDPCREKKKKSLPTARAKKCRIAAAQHSGGVQKPPPRAPTKSLSIFCMRCGFHMQIEQPDQFCG